MNKKLKISTIIFIIICAIMTCTSFATENISITMTQEADNRINVNINSEKKIKTVRIYSKRDGENYQLFYQSKNVDSNSKTYTISRNRLSTEQETYFKVIVIDEAGNEINREFKSGKITPTPTPTPKPSQTPKPSENNQTSPTPSSSTAPSTPTSEPSVTKIKLNTTSISLKVGKTKQLKATIEPSKAKTTTKWSTSNAKVATVSKTGLVTAKKVGKATITIKTANGKTATCQVTVKPNQDQSDGQAQNSSKTIKVLLIGNSYSYYNSIGGILTKLAMQQGKKMIVVNACHGGWGATQLAKGKIGYYYWNNTSGKVSYEHKGSNYKLTDLAKKDWGNLKRAGEWDYVILQNNGTINNSEVAGDKIIYNMIKKMIPSSKNYILYSTRYNAKNRLAAHTKTAKSLNCSVIAAGNIYSAYGSDWKNILTIRDDSSHQSGRGAYLDAVIMYSKIYGKKELASSSSASKFISVYNSSGNTIKQFTKGHYNKANASQSVMSVEKTTAKKLQALVYKYYDKYVLYK